MDQLAAVHLSPIVIGSTARRRIVGAAVAWFAATCQSFKQRARAEVVERGNGGAEAIDALARLLGPCAGGGFAQFFQTHTPLRELVWDRPNPRASDGPRDRWYVCQAALPSAESWPVVWVFSALGKLRHESRRRRNLVAAVEQLSVLRAQLLKARARLRGAAQIDSQVAAILDHHHVGRYLKVRRTVRAENAYKQTRRGRPDPTTAYRRVTSRRFDIDWSLDQAAIDCDQASDGLDPLITNDRQLSPAQVLTAHKGQPKIEKRFEQIKNVHQIAPVFLNNEGRIKVLFALYFVALLVQALIERELRLAMQRERIKELPIYPGQRQCRRPTTEQVLRLFSLAERHTLLRHGLPVQVFHPELTDLQSQAPGLLGVPIHAYQAKNQLTKFAPNAVPAVRNVRRTDLAAFKRLLKRTGCEAPPEGDELP